MSDTPITPRDRRRLADAINTLRRVELAFARADLRSLTSIMGAVDPAELVELVELIAAPTGTEITVSVRLNEPIPSVTSVFVHAGDSISVSVDDDGFPVVVATTTSKGGTA